MSKAPAEQRSGGYKGVAMRAVAPPLTGSGKYLGKINEIKMKIDPFKIKYTEFEDYSKIGIGRLLRGATSVESCLMLMIRSKSLSWASQPRALMSLKKRPPRAVENSPPPTQKKNSYTAQVSFRPQDLPGQGRFKWGTLVTRWFCLGLMDPFCALSGSSSASFRGPQSAWDGSH